MELKMNKDILVQIRKRKGNNRKHEMANPQNASNSNGFNREQTLENLMTAE